MDPAQVKPSFASEWVLPPSVCQRGWAHLTLGRADSTHGGQRDKTVFKTKETTPATAGLLHLGPGQHLSLPMASPGLSFPSCLWLLLELHRKFQKAWVNGGTPTEEPLAKLFLNSL